MRVVVMGASSGGLQAVSTVLDALAAHFPCPILLVLHRGKDSDETLTNYLQQRTALKVIEAEDKQPMERGCVHVAPVDYHLLVDGNHLALSTEEPVLHARPSIDVLFESAAFACGKQAIGVILTGASADGAQGLCKIKEAGGVAIVQDPASAEARTMPETALTACAADYVVPLEEISAVLKKLSEEVKS